MKKPFGLSDAVIIGLILGNVLIMTMVMGMMVFVFCENTYALDIPPKPTHYVNDYANALTPEQEESLNGKIWAFTDSTGAQIGVAIFQSLDGNNLEDFTNKLFNAWGIGQAGKNNGVLLAVFLNDRKMRIEVGYGNEPLIPDAVASNIIRNNIAPHFKNGDVYGGINAGIEGMISSIYARAENAPTSVAPVGPSTATVPRGRPAAGYAAIDGVLNKMMMGIVLIVGLVVLVGGISFFTKKAGKSEQPEVVPITFSERELESAVRTAVSKAVAKERNRDWFGEEIAAIKEFVEGGGTTPAIATAFAAALATVLGAKGALDADREEKRRIAAEAERVRREKEEAERRIREEEERKRNEERRRREEEESEERRRRNRNSGIGMGGFGGFGGGSSSSHRSSFGGFGGGRSGGGGASGGW